MEGVRMRGIGSSFRLFALPVFLLTLWILSFAGSVFGAEKEGSVRLTFPEGCEGVEMALFQVAEYSSGELRWCGSFEKCGLSLLSLDASGDPGQNLDHTAAALAEFAASEGMQGTAPGTVGGRALFFGDLGRGWYLAAQVGAQERMEVQSILFPLPFQDGESDEPGWEAEFQPKTVEIPAESEAGEGTLTVVKSLKDGEGKSVKAEHADFYVALFRDEDRSRRASDVKVLRFRDSGEASVTFENLPLDSTFFLGETDRQGFLVTGDLHEAGIYVPVYPDGYEVELTRAHREASLAFQNVIRELTHGHNYEAHLKLVKKTVRGGTPLATEKVYYAAVFEDSDLTERIGEVIELAMGGRAEAERTVTLQVEEEGRTVYVAETDRTGKPLRPDNGLGFVVSVDKPRVALAPDHLEEEVTIVNSFEDEPESEPPVPLSEPETGEDPVPLNPGEDPPGGTPGGSGTSVRTGDDAPVGRFAAALAAAGLLLAALLGSRRGRRGEKDAGN